MSVYFDHAVFTYLQHPRRTVEKSSTCDDASYDWFAKGMPSETYEEDYIAYQPIAC